MFGKGRQEALIQAGYRYACALANDPDVARDLVHDAWLSLLTRHGERPDKALLFRAIRHRHIDDFRRRRRAGAVEYDENDPAIHVAAAGSQGLADPSDPRLAAALASLRNVEREALVLSVVEGYTATEIGDMTGQPRGTVLSHLHRGRSHLRAMLADGETETKIETKIETKAETKAGTSNVISLEQGARRRDA